MKKLWQKVLLLSLLTIIFCPPRIDAQNLPLKHYESAFLAQEIYPRGASALDWFPDDYEVQGVTNDGQNWFFTSVAQVSDDDKKHGIMWKIPKSIPLNGNVAGKPGVKKIVSFDIPELKIDDKWQWHWGDPDHVKFDGVDYILVPIYAIVACFRADDLSFVNYAFFDARISGGGGWCAVGVDKDLYASTNDARSIVRYRIDSTILIKTKNHDALKFVDSYPLKKTDGSELVMTDMQGGEFTPTGEMLYLVSGRGACLEWLGIDGAPWSPRDGVHVIETENWTEVEQSVKRSEPSVYFSYNYDPTCIICYATIFPVGGGTDTPEGLTFWDLDDGSAPGISGSLHVLVDRYLYGGFNCDDEVFFHHYRSKVNVNDNASGGQGLLGTPNNPFSTLNEAISQYPIWDGAQIILRKGEYQLGTGIINKRIKITTEGGVSKIKR